MGKKKKTIRPASASGKIPSEEKRIEKKVNEAFRRRISFLKKALANRAATLEDYDLSQPWTSRRAAAVCKMLPAAVERYSAMYPDMDIEETFMTLCTASRGIYDDIEQFNFYSLGAALWILDRISEDKKRLEALEILPENADYDSIQVPIFYDVYHSEEVVYSVLYLIQHKNDDVNETYRSKSKYHRERYICDYAAASGKTDAELHKSYRMLLDLIPNEKKQEAIEHFRMKCLEWTDIFFQEIYEIEKKQRLAEKEYDDVQSRIGSLFSGFEDIIQKEKELHKALSSLPAPMNPNGGLSFVSDASQNFLTMLSSDRAKALSLMGELEAAEAELDAANHREAELLYWAAEAKTLRREKMSEVLGEKTAEALFSFDVDDPYEVCFALFYLMELGDDLPWLYSIPLAVLNSAAAKLPWGYDEYDELCDDVWFPDEDDSGSCHTSAREGKIINDWYELKYRSDFIADYDDGEDAPGYERNLAQIVYEKTGAIVPRKLERYEPIRKNLKKSGLTPKQIDSLLPLLAVLGEVRRQTLPKYRLDELTELPDLEVPEEETDDTSNVEEMEQEIKRLRTEVKQLGQSLHDTYGELRQSKEKLEKIEEERSSEQQELADLRELLFNQQEETYYNEKVEEDISFPHETSHRIVVFGGHDTWLKEIKPKLPNVRFIDRSAIPNAEMIRRSDIVWIQTNAISHKFYNMILEQVRKHNIPLRYFTYASAAKCAAQIIQEDMQEG